MSRGDSFGRDWDLARQIRAASVSVMANIAEGYDRRGTNELRHHLSIAAGSCSEVRSHLYVIEDEGYASSNQTEAVRHLAEEVLRLVIAFQNSIRKP